jgi:hypothetical protein
MTKNMSENMKEYCKKHTISDNGITITDSKKSAVIISLLNKVTMFKEVYFQGRILVRFKK